MAKEQAEQQVNEGVATPQMTESALHAFLEGKIRSPLGLTITVETRERPACLKGGVVSNVKVSSAWVSFTHEDTQYRTKEIPHRDNLISWASNGGIEPFSQHRDFKDAVGPPNVCFVRMGGGN